MDCCNRLLSQWSGTELGVGSVILPEDVLTSKHLLDKLRSFAHACATVAFPITPFMQASPLLVSRCLPSTSILLFSVNRPRALSQCTVLQHRRRHLYSSTRHAAPTHGRDKDEPRSQEDAKEPRQKEHEGIKVASLFAELFPRESQRPSPSKVTPAEPAKRSVPRLAIENDTPVDSGLFTPRTPVAAHTPHTNTAAPTVLMLRRVSKHLTPDDFRRVQPAGQHLRGWVPRGDVRAVIKLRDRHTLVPSGEYLLVFSDAAAATAYHEQALKAHAWAREHAPKRGRHVLPPPPQTAAVEQAYALVPPDADPEWRVLQAPFPPLIADVLERGGYDKLVRDRRSPHEVFVTLDSVQLALEDVRSAIRADGRQRGLAWLTVGRDSGVRRVKLPLQSAVERNQDGGEAASDVYAPADDLHSASQRGLQAFVVSFETADEARRFVGLWHRRRIFDLLPSETLREMPDDAVPLVNAEYVW